MRRSVFIPLMALLVLCSRCVTAAAETAAPENPGAAVSGRVLRSDGTPVEDARVTVYTRVLSDGKSSRSGPDGSFSVEGIAPGRYNIEVAAGGFCREYVTRVTVPAGGISREITVYRPGSVSGRVLDLDGKPLAGVRVNRTESDRNGFYRLDWERPGTLTLNASAEHHVRATTRAQIEEGGHTRGVDFRLQPGGALKGRVVDAESGEPVAGVDVGLHGPRYARVRTDAAGEFTAGGLPAGEYRAGFYRQGYRHHSTGGLRVVARETSRLPETRLALRPETLHLHERNWVFSPGEKVFLRYNSFRVEEGVVSVYRVDLESEIAGRGGRSRGPSRLRDLARDADIRGLEPVLEKEFEIRYPSPLSDIHNRRIDLEPLPPGAYTAVVRAGSLEGLRVSFLVTELALVSRRGRDSALFYLCRLDSGEPVPGAEITFYDDAFRVVGRGRADGQGIFETGLEHARVLASAGDSFAWLAAARRPAPESRDSLKTYLYTERPVYRPGQVVYFKGIMRRESDAGYRLPGEETVAVRVFDSRGDSFHRATLPVSENGTFDASFILPEEPPLGNYRLEAAGDSARFRVEEYRKPDFAVTVEGEKGVFFPGETLRARISAEYYFGAPVAGAEVSYAVYRRGATARHVRGYGAQAGAGETVTDQRGEAWLELPLPGTLESEEIFTIEARVVDQSRREVRGTGRVTVAPGAFRARVSLDRHLYAPDEEMVFSVRLEDYEGNPVAGQAVRLSAAWRRWEENRRVMDEFWSRETVSDEHGRLEGRLTPGEAGSLVFTVEGVDEMGNRVRATRDAWVGGHGWRASWAGGRRLEVVLDRESCEVGDTVRALINSARPDMPLLVTLEQAGIMSREIVRLDGHIGYFEFTVAEEHVPTVYLSVNAVGEKEFYSALREIAVAPTGRLLEITVESERGRYEPGETVSYRLRALDAAGNPAEAEVSFGLVDEAIYALAEETVPRIEDFFYGRRPHRVSSAYSFAEWLHAGAGKDLPGEDVRRDFRDTAWWNPRITTGSDGLAEFSLVLPDNLTTWRATARGATRDTLVGGAVHRIIAAKPLSARLILPRFLVEGDTLTVSGVLHNDTDEDLFLEVDLSAEGVEIIDYPEKNISLAAGGQGRVDWQARAGAPGEALLTLRAVSDQARDAMELSLPVLAHGQELFYSRSGEVGEETVVDTFDLPAGAIPETVRLETYLYPSLASGFFRNLHYLAHYPYGCVEQTMSRFLPLVHVAGALEEIGLEALALLADDGPAFEKMLAEMPKMVELGLGRLNSFQNADGGWGWWSADSSRPYTSAYVYYGLMRAREAGYQLDLDRLERARRFLAGVVGRVECLEEKIYILFALSLGGADDLPAGELEAAMGGRDEINAYSLALLTLVQAGREPDKAALLLEELYGRMSEFAPDMFFWRTEEPGRYGWTNSDIEATAWALRATLAVDPGREEIGPVVRYLLWRERAGSWRSTKDTAVCVMALADLLVQRDELSPDYLVRLRVGEAPVSETRVDRETLRDFSVRREAPAGVLQPGESTSVRLEKEGPGALYYTHNLEYAERREFLEARDEGFTVKRQYYRVKHAVDDHGVISETHLPLEGPVSVGDQLLVRLTVGGKDGYEYFMLEDPLPAGCEVADDVSGERRWTRREVRDRMVSFFQTSFGAAELVFEYRLRAETPGEFRILPARASMMYLPDRWGQSAENRLVIRDKP